MPMIREPASNIVTKPINTCIRAAARWCLGKKKYDNVKNDAI